MLRRQQTVYVSVDPFFSPRGKVLHGFDEFLAGLAEAQIPCVWLTSWTRAQLDESRRRLGQTDPYIGESGCGVYLPEDYFHLKARNTIRLGRYTCMPIAKPQPAAAEALEELASDLDVSVVPLRKLSQRELSQNTGLPAKEAELIRMRDFDELFFFAGASESEIRKFRAEAKARGLTLQSVGTFWSLSCGASLGDCVRELGGLYDRALRSHALRIGVTVAAGPKSGSSQADRMGRFPVEAFDRTFYLTERVEPLAGSHDSAANGLGEAETPAPAASAVRRHHFHLHSDDVWTDLIASFASKT